MSTPELKGPEPKRSNSTACGADERPPAPRRARLEVVIEGKRHFCVDGTVIGSKGHLPPDHLRRWAELEPRHLLLGMDGDAWFVFTPLTVARPFSLDGEPLNRGERRFLDRVRHHLAFDDIRIGLRLHPAEAKFTGRLRRLWGG
jgi:hypothetical protein